MLIDIRADVARNRLYLVLKGFLDTEQARSAASRTIGEIMKLKPGFVAITDISELKPTTPEGTQAILEVQQAYKRYGLGRLIRIVGDAQVTKMQFHRMASQSNLQEEYAASMADAERLADQAKKSGT